MHIAKDKELKIYTVTLIAKSVSECLYNSIKIIISKDNKIFDLICKRIDNIFEKMEGIFASSGHLLFLATISRSAIIIKFKQNETIIKYYRFAE